MSVKKKKMAQKLIILLTPEITPSHEFSPWLRDVIYECPFVIFWRQTLIFNILVLNDISPSLCTLCFPIKLYLHFLQFVLRKPLHAKQSRFWFIIFGSNFLNFNLRNVNFQFLLLSLLGAVASCNLLITQPFPSFLVQGLHLIFWNGLNIQITLTEPD